MAAATFLNRLKIGAFSGDVRLKTGAFHDCRSHFGQVADILNVKMPDFLKVWYKCMKWACTYVHVTTARPPIKYAKTESSERRCGKEALFRDSTGSIVTR